MQRCPVCNGRTLMVDESYRCMLSSCEGSRPVAVLQGIYCRCGEPMSYQGEDSWGQPNYICIHCKIVKRIER